MSGIQNLLWSQYCTLQHSFIPTSAFSKQKLLSKNTEVVRSYVQLQDVVVQHMVGTIHLCHPKCMIVRHDAMDNTSMIGDSGHNPAQGVSSGPRRRE